MRSLPAFAAALVMSASVPAMAQDEPAPGIDLELNSLDQAETGCRMSFLVHNRMAADIAELAVEIVLFDGDGRADRFLSLKTGRLPEDKTRLRQFEVEGLACEGVSRILVNDVTECTGEGLDAAACLDGLAVSSRVDVQLVL